MKVDPFDKTNYGPISISPFYLKLLNAAYMITFMNILILYYQKFNMPSEKVSVFINCYDSKMEEKFGSIQIVRCATHWYNKAFDWIAHDFLIAKLEAHGLSYEALKVMRNYLTERKHRTVVNNSFSDFIDLLLGVPQGSV